MWANMISRYKEFSDSEVEYFGKLATKLCNMLSSIKRPSSFTNEEFIKLFSNLSKDFTKLFISKPLTSKTVELSNDEADLIVSNATNLAIKTFNLNTKCLVKIGKKTKKTTCQKDGETYIREKLAKVAIEYNDVFTGSPFTFIYFTSILSCVVSNLNGEGNIETIQSLLGDLTKAK